jgi:Ca2+-transporting ATPase
LQAAWHRLEKTAVVAQMGSDLKKGLMRDQVLKRLQQYGPNRLQEKPRPTWLRRLLEQFNSFLVMLLLAAAAVSLAVGISEYGRTGNWSEFVDAIAIVAIVVLNAILGLVQEGRAEESLAALKKMAAPNATVIREGHQGLIPAAELVPGDLVVLETGNYMPADVRLVESVNLRVDESALTGESVSVGI